MGANPNIFQNKQNRRVVPPGDENFFVTAEEFQAIDAAFATKSDQTEVDSIDGRLDTAEGDIDGLQTQVGIIEGNLTIAEGNIGTLLGDVSTLQGDVSNLETSKQDTLVSGTNIKTINGLPVLGSGDLEIQGGAVDFNDDQFDVIEAVETIKSIFLKSDGYTIDFLQSSDHGTLEAPIYGELDIVRTGGINKNKVVVISSSVAIPSQIGASKPSWIVTTGDAYDTSFGAVNELTFTFHTVYKDGVTSIANAVVCDIVAHPAFNQDPSPWYEGVLVNAMFNDNRVLSSPDTLNNNVVWDTSDVNVQIEGGANASFTDLTGGNYAIRTGQTSGTRIVVITSAAVHAKMNNAALTVISRFRGGGATGSRVIASNIDTGTNTGFTLVHNNSDQIVRFEIGQNVSGERLSWSTGIATNSETWIEIMATFKAPIGRIWSRIPSVPLAFGRRAEKTNYTHTNINSTLPIRLDQTNSGSTPPNWNEKDYVIIYVGETHLPGQVGLDIFDNPSNAAKIIQDWEHPNSPIIFLNDPQPQAGGFAGLYNGGLGVSGGREGRILEYDNYERLLEDLRNSDPDEREEYRYTGEDYTTTNFESTVVGRMNKSIVGRGQTIKGIQHRNNICQNIIWQNLEMIPAAATDRDAINFQGCVGFWLHRMRFYGEGRFQATHPTTFSDSLIDIGAFNLVTPLGTQSDLFTISDCILEGSERGILIGYNSSDNHTLDGKLRGTIINTHFKNLRQRQPLTTGLIHLVNILQDNDVVALPNVPLGIAAYFGGRIYAENNYYERGDQVYRFESSGGSTGGILDIGSFRNNAGYVVPAIDDQPYNSNLVTWTPAGETGYIYPKALVSPADARTWILANAGATLTEL